MAAKNDILTSLKTLLTSWRSSHRSVLQREQLFRISVLQTIKLSGFSISFKKISKKEFNFSNLAGLQAVISLEIELNNHYFSIILEVKC